MKIEDYGFIGDLHSGALVGPNGAIDWLCWPRFDSDACFAALLGDEGNGCWRVGPADGSQGRQRYRQDTLVLETEFATASGTAVLIDFMPWPARSRQIVRIVEGRSGRVDFALKLVIRFDNGRSVPWVRQVKGALRAIAGPNALSLFSDVETHGENLSTVAEFSVVAGERREFVLAWHPSHDGTPERGEPAALLAATEQH